MAWQLTWLGQCYLWHILTECVNSRDGLEDPLDDSGMVIQQLDQMSVIARCEYGKTCQLLVQLFNNAAQTYQEMVSNMGTSKVDISIQEGKISQLSFGSWLWCRPTNPEIVGSNPALISLLSNIHQTSQMFTSLRFCSSNSQVTEASESYGKGTCSFSLKARKFAL